MHKVHGLLLAALLFPFVAFAQTPNLSWVSGIQSTSFVFPTDIEVDPSGNVFLTGYFDGTVDFNPGLGVDTLTSFGFADAFVAKYSSTGSLVWARQLGSTYYDIANSIALDNVGNVYTTGTFNVFADFDPGPGTHVLSSAGATDAFISKLDASGNFVWARSFGGSGSDSPQSILVDAFGFIVLAGHFENTVDFDPGPGYIPLSSAGNLDIFVAKFNSTGGFTFARRMGGNFPDQAFSVVVDDTSNIYTTGNFASSVDFDPGTGTAMLSSAGNADIFVSKLNALGNFVWAKRMGGNAFDGASSIALDAANNVLTTGYFSSTADFDPGAGTYNLSSAGGADLFVSKLDAAANFVWAKRMGTTTLEEGNSIAVDAAGSAYISGYFENTVDLDPGAGTYNLTVVGQVDIFCTKLNSSGNFVWATQFGGTGQEQDGVVELGAGGAVFLSGPFQNTVDFDPGAPVQNMTATSAYACFLLKLGQCLPTSATQTASACNSYTWPVNSQTYTTSGPKTATIPNAAGCDSTITLNLTIRQSSSATQTASACNSYTWPVNSQTYTTSGPKTATIPNAAGCDSTITLNLTIRQSSSATQTASACNSYTWPVNSQTYTTSGAKTATIPNAAGCDSTITLNLTIRQSSSATQTASACNSYTWPVNSQTYTTSGAKTATIPNAAGCDSTITLNLTIRQSSSATQTATACDSYTWPVNNQTYTTSGPKTAVVPNAAGCDSVITLNLTLNNSTSTLAYVGTCDSFVAADGAVYHVSGVYTAIVPTFLGCDSIITYNLNVYLVNTTVTDSSGTLVSDAPLASHQWLDCQNGYAVVPGESGRTFTPGNNGSFAVQVTEFGCIDTSACYTAGSTHAARGFQDKGVILFPNPAQHSTTVRLTPDFGQATLRLHDAMGVCRHAQDLGHGNETILDLQFLPAGLYQVEINSPTKTAYGSLLILR